MLILVDINENATNPDIVEDMRKVFPDLQLVNLQFGDVNVILDDASILAIERKKAGDFLGSVGDGRLFRQVEQMHEGAKWVCVFVEGELKFDKNDMVVADGRTTEWKGSSIRGALHAIQWSGCPVFFTDTKHYPYLVNEVAGFCSKPDIHFQQLGHRRIVTFPPISLDTEILSAFPGVGLKRAKALQEFARNNNDNEVGTLAESLCWITSFPLISPNDRPTGWGDKLVANVRAVLGLNPWEYLDIKVDEKQRKEMENVGRRKKK